MVISGCVRGVLGNSANQMQPFQEANRVMVMITTSVVKSRQLFVSPTEIQSHRLHEGI